MILVILFFVIAIMISDLCLLRNHNEALFDITFQMKRRNVNDRAACHMEHRYVHNGSVNPLCAALVQRFSWS